MKLHEPFCVAFNKAFRKEWICFKRSRGSHQIFYKIASNITVTVPVHGSKDVKKGTFLAILKQAGIDKNQAKLP